MAGKTCFFFPFEEMMTRDLLSRGKTQVENKYEEKKKNNKKESVALL